MNWIKSPFTTLEERQKKVPGALYEIEDYQGKLTSELPAIENLDKLAMAVVERLVGKEIVIVGDYDCDGIMSTIILYKALLFLTEVAEKLSGRPRSACEIIVPDREKDGYGFSVSHAEKMHKKTVILLDNGIVQYDAITKAKENGNEVFIVDHHEPGEHLPDADIIVNPHALKGGEFNNYCAAGLTYRLVRKMYEQSWVTLEALAEKLHEALFMAAVATVADVVPMLYENRVIVKEGMKSIPPRWDSICFTLMDTEKRCLNEGDIAFKIAPAINAVGRLGELDADFVKELALSDEADRLAARMQYLNSLRKQMTKEAIKTLPDKTGEAKVIVVKGEKIPAGITGIIAGNLSAKYGKPVFVFGESKDGEITGSARAVKGTLHLKKLLDEIESQIPGLTVKYGGHESAAGVTIKEASIKTFEKAANDLASYAPVTEKQYDFDLCNTYDWFAVYDGIQKYAPYGEGNPPPMLHVHVSPAKEDIKIMAKEHIKINYGLYEAVGFNMAGRLDPEKPDFDLYGTLQLNEYRGGVRVQLNIEDFAQSGESVAVSESKPTVMTDLARMLAEQMRA